MKCGEATMQQCSLALCRHAAAVLELVCVRQCSIHQTVSVCQPTRSLCLWLVKAQMLTCRCQCLTRCDVGSYCCGFFWYAAAVVGSTVWQAYSARTATTSVAVAPAPLRTRTQAHTHIHARMHTHVHTHINIQSRNPYMLLCPGGAATTVWSPTPCHSTSPQCNAVVFQPGSCDAVSAQPGGV